MHKPRFSNPVKNVLLAFWFLVASTLASAHEWVVERSWIEDPSGNMTLAQVKQAPQTPLHTRFFSQGYSQSYFWLRLHLVPAAKGDAAPEERLVVRIRPPYQNQIQIFDPLADHVRTTGVRYPWSTDEHQSLNYNFAIPQGQAPRDIWLRLRTDKSTFTVADVLTEREVKQEDRRQEMIFMGYMAILLLYLGWGGMSWWQTRDKLIGAYVVRETVTVFYAFAVLGYSRVFLSDIVSPQILDAVTYSAGLLFPFCVFWFDYKLLKTFKPNRWLINLLGCLLIVAFSGASVMVALGMVAMAVKLMSLFVLAAMLLVIPIALTTSDFTESNDPNTEKLVSKPFLVTIYGVSLLAALSHRLLLMGAPVGTDLLFYSQFFYPLLTGAFFIILLQVRAQRLLRRNQMAASRLVLVEIEAEQEKRQHQEQTNFLRMLTHELKTPLSVLRLITDSALKSHQMSAHADKAINSINGIIDRCMKVDRMTVGPQEFKAVMVDPLEVIVGYLDSANAAARCDLVVNSRRLLQTDPLLFKTIISNLIDNALKYAPPDTLVHIEFGEEGAAQGTSYRIVIENEIGKHGAPDPAKVFEKYYRNPMAARETGSGLGLYLVKTLVERLGGHVAYKTEGNQVCFELKFPCAATMPGGG